jgi:HSP20 family protein
MGIRTTFPRTSLWCSRPRRRTAHPFFGDLWLDFGFAPLAGLAAFHPRIDVSETDEELRLAAELPGLEDGDFEVTVDGDVIAIKGEKKLAPDRTAEHRGRSERMSGVFARSFRVPFDIDPDSVKGSYRNGVLRVVVPKPAESQVRTIPVETA